MLISKLHVHILCHVAPGFAFYAPAQHKKYLTKQRETHPHIFMLPASGLL